MNYSENYQEEQEAFCPSCIEIRTEWCSARSVLARHKLLDLTEGNSWVRYLDHGPISDIITVFSQQAGLFWGLKGKLDSCAGIAFAKSLTIGSEKDARNFKRHSFPGGKQNAIFM